MASSLPRTVGELQLYRILQRANLLSYFDAFIQQGGDDVQQLCEAGEEEFLEIMALVGMASKPLHVRRLQKALRDWVTNPGIFNQPLTSLPVSSIPIYKLPESSPPILGLNSSSYERNSNAREPHIKIPKCAATTCVQSLGPGKSDGVGNSPLQNNSEGRHWQSHHTTESEHSLSPADLGSPASPRDTTETLDASAALSVSECVERMFPSLPKSDINEVREMLKTNKKLSKMIGHIFEMGDEEPHREEEIRKYSAIYGRFDSKRKDGKHLTLHELTVNEAAAQLCMKDIALLTRRDELFTLARQISREVTYKYTNRTTKSKCEDQEELSPKRIKTEENFYEYQETLITLHQQMESLKEQMTVAKAKGEERAAHSLQAKLEKNLSKQMDILRNSEYDRLTERCHSTGYYLKTSEDSSPNTIASDSSESHVERPLNLRTSNHQSQQLQQHMSDGEQHLGKQLCNELSGHYSSSETNAQYSDNIGILKDYSQAALNNTKRKVIKLEPEDTR